MIKFFSSVFSLMLVILFFAQAAQSDSIRVDSTQSSVIDTIKVQNGVPQVTIDSMQSTDTDTMKAQNGAPIQTVIADSTIKSEPERSAVVVITSEPQGAAVLLNDSVLGTTPVVASDIIPGKYNLILKMKGYYQKRAEIVVSLKDTQVVHLELLKPASVYFNSKPSGAMISLNGKAKGVTPLLDSLLKPGEYRVGVTLTNYHAVEKTILIGNGVIDTVSITMISNEAKKDTTVVPQKTQSRIKRYSGLIGAIAFVVFAIIILIGERNDL